MSTRFLRAIELAWRLLLCSPSLLSAAGEKGPGQNCPLLICGHDFNSLGLRAVVGIRLLWLSIGNQNVTATGKGLEGWKKGKGHNPNPKRVPTACNSTHAYCA